MDGCDHDLYGRSAEAIMGRSGIAGKCQIDALPAVMCEPPATTQAMGEHTGDLVEVCSMAADSDQSFAKFYLCGAVGTKCCCRVPKISASLRSPLKVTSTSLTAVGAGGSR